MKDIVFVTGNENKIKEVESILGFSIDSKKLSLDEIQTLDPVECVVKKAREAFKSINKPIIVEDTNLFFKAWKGLPGVFIDYFLKTVDREGLLKMLENSENRGAYAQTSYCYFDGEKEVVGIGKINGTISPEVRGESNFGWDPIFIPGSHDRTFAQMSKEEKNSISMRKKALFDLKEKLKESNIL